MRFRIVTLACVAMLSGAASAQAQQEVKIGVLDPLSGPTAQIGIDAVAAIKTAAEIVNEGADLPLALARNKGLPGLGGAKVILVVVDHQGKPEVGQSETERLISQEKVQALIGAYFSSVTAAASQAAERAGVPFINGDSTQPALTQRGLKYFFRTTPTDENFSELMFDFLKDFAAKSGQKFQSVSLFHEDTAYGTDSAKVQERLAGERGFRVLEKIAYRAQTTSLTAEVQRLKAANADVLMPSSYTSERSCCCGPPRIWTTTQSSSWRRTPGSPTRPSSARWARTRRARSPALPTTPTSKATFRFFPRSTRSSKSIRTDVIFPTFRRATSPPP